MLAAWAASSARFREDANAEEDLARGGYRDRVVIELAQNAADAAARAGVRGKLRLELDGEVLRAANTGAAIDAAGVESASTLRASAKRDHATVGRFGVGFAAVLAVSDEPAIVSKLSAVRWSRDATLAAVREIPSLQQELARRADDVPVLRLPFLDESGRQPPEGYDTEVVLPLRDLEAVELVRELLSGVDAALLLTLPGLASVDVVVDGFARRLVAERTADGVVVDGIAWKLHSISGELDPALLRDRPIEERARREYDLTWAVPIDDRGVPLPMPPSVPAVVHAPTPTDEPLSLPALLIAPFPLDVTRRHVAPGPLRDFLVERAADAYVELVAELPVVPEVLLFVPVSIASGALDGELHASVIARLRQTAFLPGVDDGVRLRPAHAAALDEAEESLTHVLADVMPNLLPASWVRRGQSALAVLGVRRLMLAEIIDELTTIERSPTWWRLLYSALGTARVPADVLAGLPVPLASGELAHSPRGLLMPGALGDLAVLGLRGVHEDAAHPLLPRLGAIDADPAAVVADGRVRAAVENSYDADDPAAVADAVLRLVGASGASVGEYPWLAELALPGDDGELYVAGELLIPQGIVASLVVDDSPFGVVDAALLKRWGRDVLVAVGVLDTFALVHESDVADADHDLDREREYFDVVAGMLNADEPVVIDDFLAVRDLEFVRNDSWPRALRILAQPPFRAAVVGQVLASTSARRLRVLPYTAWWLREHTVVRGRLATSDPLLEGLYDVIDVDLDDEFLVAAGALRDIADADADDVMARLGDAARAVSRMQVRELYARVAPSEPPDRVRGVLDGELVVAAADDAVVVDQPDLLPLLGNLAIVPASLDDAERVADVLDVALASELAAFEVVSTGVARDDYVVHDALMVTDVDGVHRRVPWRLADGVLHVDREALDFGLGRGRAWRAGAWESRHVETELVREPARAHLLRAEEDLDR